MSGLQSVAVGLSAALIVGTWTVYAVRARRRSQGIAHVAMTAGIRFAHHAPFNLPSHYARLELMQLGHARSAANLIEGFRGESHLRGFDYSYEVGLGAEREVREAGVVVAEGPYSFPLTVIRPVSAGHLLGAYGAGHMGTGDSTFDERFRLTCDEAHFAERLLTEPLRRFLLNHAEYTWELNGNWLAIYRDRLLTPREGLKALRMAERFLARAPQDLLADVRHPSAYPA